MRFLKYGLGALVLYLVFLVVTVPVGLVWQWVPKPQGVQLQGLDGTLWSGRADRLTVAGRRLESLTWEVDPWSLLGGRVEAVVAVAGDVQGRGTVSYGLSGLALQGVRLESPIGTLVGNRRLPFRTKVTGEVQLNLAEGSQGQPWCDRLSGRILVQQLDVNNQYGAFPLGNLAGTLSCSQGNLKLTMTERDNRIGVAGTALLKGNMEVQLDASIRATVDQPEAMANSLDFLGQPDASGAYPLRYSGRLPGF
ncbi:type II secretion system protein N [Ferrimonas sediminicola]|uniref:Type II secretion system protein N n=1 Tax=Ferrimonas sediminicola TaxID=2569538 RepID=A0A4U1BA20_9GAMM|nr:type II secretion system protein N [Ferrimonas sediminicola]TKB47649.1 type II secretion system protein N [Ferrimonas sediminicola]